MQFDDLRLVLVRYGSDTGLISLEAGTIICHTVDRGDGGVEWPKGIPVVDVSDESVFTALMGQSPSEPAHNWEDVLKYVLAHQRELKLAAADPATRIITMTVVCMEADAEDVLRSLYRAKGRCWYYDHDCPLGPIKTYVRLPTEAQKAHNRDCLDVEADKEAP